MSGPQGRRPPAGTPTDRPTHPTLVAALLMVGIVVFIVVVSLLGAVGR